MKCARLHLQERSKAKSVRPDTSRYAAEKPLRYCQKRMINPEHEEDPRWTDIYERYRCDEELENSNDTLSSCRGYPETEDLFLSVQTLKFQGNSEEPKRWRRGFKYKSPSDGAKHRMFVKQTITDDGECSDDDDGRSSQLSSYYYDDYVKYIFNNDKSRPTSAKSSIFHQSLGSKKDNATQSDEPMGDDTKLTRNVETKVKSVIKKYVNKDTKNEIQRDTNTDDTKITFHKSGRRKSLTISRTQSPETVQVIRVDVVRNHNRGSAMSDYEDKKRSNTCDSLTNSDIENVDIKKSHYANKYLLTNTIKTLDESLSGGEKVTLLCKTFKLSERSQTNLMNRSKLCPEVKQACVNRNNASSHLPFFLKAKILK